MLHQQAPDKGDRADDFLHFIAQLQNISKVNLPEDGLHGPLSIRSCDNLLGKESSDADSCKVEKEERDKAGPDCSLYRSGIPHNAAEGDSTKVGNHEGINHWNGETFDLSNDIVGPGTSKGLEETDQNHDEIDVKVNDVQEVKSSIGTVHDGEEETNDGDYGCEPEAREVLEEDCINSKAVNLMVRG